MSAISRHASRAASRPRSVGIIVTLGPAWTPLRPPDRRMRQTIDRMLAAGASVVRINASQIAPRAAGVLAALVRTLRSRARIRQHRLSVLLDLGGPKVRVGPVLGRRCALLRPGQHVVIGPPLPRPSGANIGCTHPDAVASAARTGDRMLLDDGAIELIVRSVSGCRVDATVVQPGILRSGKGLNLPGRDLGLPALTGKDLRDLDLAAAFAPELVALSFVRSAQDIRKLRQELGRRGSTARIVAKIETPQALADLAAIVAATDLVMAARGDLSVEIGTENVPRAQEVIHRTARRFGKPVITATQLLQSMVDHSRPTVAEATDVANALRLGSAYVMLSAETAVGAHPVAACAWLTRIVTATMTRDGAGR